jgi:Protein of unknown function (DUF3822)
MISWQKYFIIAYKTMQNQQININNRKTVVKANEAVHIILQVQKSGIVLCALKVFNNEIAFTTYYEHTDGGADGRSIMAIIKDCKPLNIKSCIVGLDDERYMLLPKGMGSIEDLSMVFGVVHHIENNEILEKQFLPWQDMFGLYLIKNTTKHVFSDWDTNILFANAAVCLLVLYPAYLKPQITQIFISIIDAKFTLSVYEKTKLTICNSFEWQSVDDVLYQVQKAIDILELQNYEIQLNGYHAPKFLIDIQKHYKNTTMQTLPNGFIYPIDVDATNSSFLIPLLAIAKYANH